MGRDKRLIEWDGVALWRRQFDLLASLHPTELMISGPAEGPWADEGLRVVKDARSNAGPLAGLCTALGAAA
jgi:molybdopterin-guanine dinucleotide biosynthesis protein A